MVLFKGLTMAGVAGGLNFAYSRLTPFTRRVTVSHKAKKFHLPGLIPGLGRGEIVDDTGRTLKVACAPAVGNFQIWNTFDSMTEGETYDVEGYGLNLPHLGLHQNITAVHPMGSAASVPEKSSGDPSLSPL